MVTVVKKGTSKKKILMLIKKVFEDKKNNGIDASKYLGKIKIFSNPVQIQKELRNEWE